MTHLFRIYSRYSHLFSKLDLIWHNHILPELLTHSCEEIKKSIPSKSTTEYCVCKTSDDLDNMVGCDSCNDWFHPRCLNLKRLPLTKKWYCPACRKKNRKDDKA